MPPDGSRVFWRRRPARVAGRAAGPRSPTAPGPGRSSGRASITIAVEPTSPRTSRPARTDRSSSSPGRSRERLTGTGRWSPTGRPLRLWNTTFDGPAGQYDLATDIAVSPDGTRLFVTGDSRGLHSGIDWQTFAYDARTGASVIVTGTTYHSSLRELHYITPIANLASILPHGFLSHPLPPPAFRWPAAEERHELRRERRTGPRTGRTCRIT